jgi:hypothetical protein
MTVNATKIRPRTVRKNDRARVIALRHGGGTRETSDAIGSDNIRLNKRPVFTDSA